MHRADFEIRIRAGEHTDAPGIIRRRDAAIQRPDACRLIGDATAPTSAIRCATRAGGVANRRYGRGTLGR